MRRYRRRPKEIEAVQFHEANAEAVARWCGGHLETKATGPDELVLRVPRVGKSTLTLYLGDYLYRLDDGALGEMGQAPFESLYEPAD